MGYKIRGKYYVSGQLVEDIFGNRVRPRQPVPDVRPQLQEDIAEGLGYTRRKRIVSPKDMD